MSLPPEQINIKRRREEEPVDTLCKKSSSGPDHPFLRQESIFISYQLTISQISNLSYTKQSVGSLILFSNESWQVARGPTSLPTPRPRPRRSLLLNALFASPGR